MPPAGGPATTFPFRCGELASSATKHADISEAAVLADLLRD